jgi:hypothetical protein
MLKSAPLDRRMRATTPRKSSSIMNPDSGANAPMPIF